MRLQHLQHQHLQEEVQLLLDQQHQHLRDPLGPPHLQHPHLQEKQQQRRKQALRQRQHHALRRQRQQRVPCQSRRGPLCSHHGCCR